MRAVRRMAFSVDFHHLVVISEKLFSPLFILKGFDVCQDIRISSSMFSLIMLRAK